MIGWVTKQTFLLLFQLLMSSFFVLFLYTFLCKTFPIICRIPKLDITLAGRIELRRGEAVGRDGLKQQRGAGRT